MLIPLRSLIDDFTTKARPIQLLGIDQVGALAVAALRFLAGYTRLETDYETEEALLPPPISYDLDTCIHLSEWALIKPLFMLYVERESAIQLEASRGLGIDVFGRSVSEIEQDIRAYEQGLPLQAFTQPILSLVPIR